MPEASLRLKPTQRVLLAIVPTLASWLIRLLGATWRYEDIQAEGVPLGHIRPGPVVFAFWHGSLLLAAYRFRNLGIAILISRSFDGELIARTAEKLGFLAVRGSSTRGGAAGLRGMADAYLAGHRCAFTADGPKGPARIAKPGPVQLAALVNATWIGAFSIEADRAWRLRSWDAMVIPKPFATLRFGWPKHAGADPANAQAEVQAEVQAALDEADRLARVEPLPARP